MNKLVKIVDNKYVQIEEYRNPNICFNTNEYNDFEDYCTLRETFDPFEIFYENQKLKKQVEEKENIACNWKDSCLENAGKIEILEIQQKEFIKYLETWKENEEYCYLSSSPIDRCRKDIYEEILQKYKSIIGGNKDE